MWSNFSQVALSLAVAIFVVDRVKSDGYLMMGPKGRRAKGEEMMTKAKESKEEVQGVDNEAIELEERE